jgi:hypothetical protein
MDASVPGGEDDDRHTHDCPERPTTLDPSELGFVRKPMVRWLDPRQLVDTAVRVVVSGIFGAYADKRELQALTASVSTTQAVRVREPIPRPVPGRSPVCPRRQPIHLRHPGHP